MPQHANSNKILPCLKFFNNVFKSMDRFCSKIALLTSFRNKFHFIIGHNLANFKYERWVLVTFISEHTIEQLGNSDVNVRWFGDFNFIKQVLELFALELNIWVSISVCNLTDWVVHIGISKLILWNMENSIIFILKFYQIFKFWSPETWFCSIFAVPFKLAPWISDLENCSSVIFVCLKQWIGMIVGYTFNFFLSWSNNNNVSHFTMVNDFFNVLSVRFSIFLKPWPKARCCWKILHHVIRGHRLSTEIIPNEFSPSLFQK